jgi:hypothetical protein
MAGAAALPILLGLPGRVFAATQIHQLQGRVYINNHPARPDTPIAPGSKIEVLQGAQLAFSLGGDAFLLRPGTTLEIAPGDGIVVGGLRLVTGALLAVFDKRRQPVSVTTEVATIGIRGTAIYLDLQPHTLYGCTCYGETDVHITGTEMTERISATHHHPYEVAPGDDMVMAMTPMPVKNHTDDELRVLEGYVGRKPEFDK